MLKLLHSMRQSWSWSGLYPMGSDVTSHPPQMTSPSQPWQRPLNTHGPYISAHMPPSQVHQPSWSAAPWPVRPSPCPPVHLTVLITCPLGTEGSYLLPHAPGPSTGGILTPGSEGKWQLQEGWWRAQAQTRRAEPRGCAELAPHKGCQGHLDPVSPAHDPPSPSCWGCARPGPPTRLGPHLDGPLQLRLLVSEPQHPDDGQGHTQPVEEAEEVDDGEDVVGEGVQQGHEALQAERGGSVSQEQDGLEDAGHRRWDTSAGLTALAHSCFKGRPSLSNTPLRSQKAKAPQRAEGNEGLNPVLTAVLPVEAMTGNQLSTHYGALPDPQPPGTHRSFKTEPGLCMVSNVSRNHPVHLPSQGGAQPSLLELGYTY